MIKYFRINRLDLCKYLVIVPLLACSSALFSKSLQPLLDVAYNPNTENFMKYAGIFIGLGVLDMIFFYCHKIFREKLRSDFLIGLKKDIFSGILKMDIGSFQKNAPSYYISVIQRDVQEINTQYYDAVCGIYRVIVSFIITFIVLLFINPILALLNVVVAFLTVTLPKIFEKKLEAVSGEASEKAEEYQSVLSDALLGFNTIRLFSITAKIEQQVESRNTTKELAQYRSSKINFTVSWISILCSQLGYILTLVIGVFLVLNGTITVGGIVAVSQLIGGILAPFEELPAYVTDLKSVKVIVRKAESLIDTQSEAFSEERIPLRDVNIDIKNLTFGYDEKTILKNINLNFEEGSKYILLGESGSGKSTLAKVLLNFYPSKAGDILIGGTSLRQLPQNQLYSLINYMQQDVFLFDDTIYNNITLYQNYDEEKVKKIVDDVGLTEYIDNLSDGWNTVINGNGYNLSGGQKQRIGLARSLLSGAKIIIFDEVTSNLDVVLEKKIEETIMGLRDITVIMITHRLNKDTIVKADKLIVLKNGELSESGSYDELIDKKGLFYSYFMISDMKWTDKG